MKNLFLTFKIPCLSDLRRRFGIQARKSIHYFCYLMIFLENTSWHWQEGAENLHLYCQKCRAHDGHDAHGVHDDGHDDLLRQQSQVLELLYKLQQKVQPE